MSIAQPETIDYTKQSELEILLEDIMPYEDTDDPDHKTHIINPAMNGHIQKGIWMTAQQIVDQARFLGLEVVTLCGHRFVPKANPEKYDACEACMKIAGHLMSEAGE